jgi:YqaJ-like viral recombinase domain
MTIEKLNPTTREDWLELRRKDVTASAIGALLGIHPHISYFELYMEKTGLVRADPMLEEGPLLRGQMMEQIALQMIKRRKPEWELLANPIPGGFYFRDPDKKLGATPDCFVRNEDKVPGIIQIKSVEPSIFRRTWLQDDELVVPLWIAIQAMVEAILTKSEIAYVCPIRVGFSIDIDLIEIPIRPDVMATVDKALEEFWLRLAEARPPEPDYKRDAKILAQLIPGDDGSTISLAHDNAFVDATQRRQSLKARIKADEEELKECETLMKASMGAATIATTADHIVSFKSQHRKAYTVPASTFRVLRVTEIGGH